MLSTYEIPKESMSRAVVVLLLDRLNGGHKNIMSLEVEGRLAVRESCHRVDETSQTEYYI
jgi:DNA-binding LacI/PurR family transcriptional regulator